jgi:hypothetical protein
VLVKVRPKEYESPEQIEYVSFADELTASFGLHQYAIEFVKPPLGYHIHVRHYLVTL